MAGDKADHLTGKQIVIGFVVGAVVIALGVRFIGMSNHGDGSAGSAPNEKPLAQVGDDALFARGCSGLDSEETADLVDEEVRKGDNEAFAMTIQTRGRHFDQGTLVKVVGLGRSRKRVELDGQKWWVAFDCVRKQ